MTLVGLSGVPLDLELQELYLLPARVVQKISVTPGACWIWVGAVSKNKYGMTYYQGRVQGAHRAVYQILRGSVGKLELDHLCRVRNCVNPGHMEPVSTGVNVKRGIMGRERATHCPKGHPYSGSNLYRMPPTPSRPNGSRQCRRCNAERSQERRNKEKNK